MKTASQTIRIYWRYTKRHVWLVLRVMLIAPGSALIAIVAPIFIAALVNRIADQSLTEVSQMWPYVLGFLASYGVGVAFNHYGMRGINLLESRVVEEINNYVLDHYLRLSYGYFNNMFGGSLVARASRFARAYVAITDTLFFEALGMLVTLVFATVALSFYDPWLGLIMLVLSTLISILIVAMAARRFPYRRRAAKAESKVVGQLADTITNVHTVKTFSHEKLEKQLYDVKVKDALAKQLKSRNLNINNGTVIMFLAGVLQVAVLYILVSSTISGAMEIGTFLLAQLYTARIITNFFRTSGVVRNIEAALGEADEMAETLALTPEVEDKPKARNLAIKHGHIEFRDVSFQYSDNVGQDELFDQLNLTVSAGEKVGLVGPSGGGKTTVTKLLLRFMDINSGAVLIDDQDIAKAKQASLRSNIAYVPQEPILFHRTLQENIRYGRLDATDKEIKQAAKQAHALEFIEEMPDGLETLVGERGVKLSGGQRQRIAIARAILKDAPILVLDEATSSLDSESEQYIQAALAELMKGRTSIVIAHRLSTIQKMDRIVVLAGGEIIEDGTHDELLELDGMYAELWAHQSGGFIEELVQA